MTYSFTGNGNWSTSANWLNNMLPPAVLPEGDTIIIATSPGDSCLLNQKQIITTRGNLIIKPGSSLIVATNLVIGNNSFSNFPNKVGDTWTYFVSDTLVYTIQNPGIIDTFHVTVTVADSVHFASGINANMWIYNFPTYKDTNYVYQSNDSVICLNRLYAYQNWDNLPISKLYIIPSRLYSSWQYQPDYADMPNEVILDSKSDLQIGQNYFLNVFHIGGFVGHIDEFFIIEEWTTNEIGVVKRYYNNVDGSHGMAVLYHKTSWILENHNLH